MTNFYDFSEKIRDNPTAVPEMRKTKTRKKQRKDGREQKKLRGSKERRGKSKERKKQTNKGQRQSFNSDFSNSGFLTFFFKENGKFLTFLVFKNGKNLPKIKKTKIKKERYDVDDIGS